MSYPAAHSMDTTWFCIDGNGHVAVAETWEAGALPEAWRGRQDGGDDVLTYLQRYGPPVDPRAFTTDPPQDGTPVGLSHPSPTPGRYWELLLSVAHPRVRDLIPGALPVHTTHEHWVSAMGPMPVEVIADLLERGFVTGGWSGGTWRPSWFGLYQYEHDSRYENTRSGPYVLEGQRPRTPLHADALPAELRALAIRLTEIRFARDDRFQPITHVPCVSHQSVWVDLDGNEHPLPD